VYRWQVDWKPARVTDLVDQQRDLVCLQYVDLHQVLCGLGEFQLAAPFSYHAVSQMCWNAMTDEARACLHPIHVGQQRQVQPATVHRYVIGPPAQLTVTGSPRIARKKGQRHRPAAERTDRSD